jgi:hypothetical protein
MEPGLGALRGIRVGNESDRILHIGLHLVVDLLKPRLADNILATVQSDQVAARLAARVEWWLTAAGSGPPGRLERAVFRLRTRGGLLAAPAYLLRLSLLPTEEEWKGGPEKSRHLFLDAVGRPFRLARKYGRGGKI